MPQWHFPCDPACPVYGKFVADLCDDPMTHAMGAPVDEIISGFARKHLTTCARCRDYGCANVDVAP